MLDLTLGADPEVFVARDGRIIPVIGLLGGTKARPLAVPQGAVQEDNVLAEFNIDPASTQKEWVDNITRVLQELDLRLFDKGCESVIASSYNFDRGALLDAGPEAMAFGCDPDYDAWLRRRNNPPSSDATLRTAGGHIHVGGLGKLNKQRACAIIKRMDLFLGVPSVLMDTDTRRRSMYGKAGCFRIKPYGVEYRSLSNFWIKDVAHMEWAYRNACRAVYSDLELDFRVSMCINHGDVDAARELVQLYDLEVI